MKRIASLAKAQGTFIVLPVKPSRNSQESLSLRVSALFVSPSFFLEFACFKNYIHVRSFVYQLGTIFRTRDHNPFNFLPFSHIW